MNLPYHSRITATLLVSRISIHNFFLMAFLVIQFRRIMFIGMTLQLIWRSICSRTLVAFVLIFAQMRSKVLGQVAWMLIRFVAVRALVIWMIDEMKLKFNKAVLGELSYSTKKWVDVSVYLVCLNGPVLYDFPAYPSWKMSADTISTRVLYRPAFVYAYLKWDVGGKMRVNEGAEQYPNWVKFLHISKFEWRETYSYAMRVYISIQISYCIDGIEMCWAAHGLCCDLARQYASCTDADISGIWRLSFHG